MWNPSFLMVASVVPFSVKIFHASLDLWRRYRNGKTSGGNRKGKICNAR